ncbi:MAG: hypothetical protein ACRD1B_05315 [Thermoanaerobaculia bacterium]
MTLRVPGRRFAYDAFLRGEEAGKTLAVSDPSSLRRALAFYEQAVALDPGFGSKP